MLLVEGKLDEEKNVLVPTDPLHRLQAFAAKSKLFTALHRKESVIMEYKKIQTYMHWISPQKIPHTGDIEYLDRCGS